MWHKNQPKAVQRMLKANKQSFCTRTWHEYRIPNLVSTLAAWNHHKSEVNITKDFVLDLKGLFTFCYGEHSGGYEHAVYLHSICYARIIFTIHFTVGVPGGYGQKSDLMLLLNDDCLLWRVDYIFSPTYGCTDTACCISLFTCPQRMLKFWERTSTADCKCYF